MLLVITARVLIVPASVGKPSDHVSLSGQRLDFQRALPGTAATWTVDGQPARLFFTQSEATQTDCDSPRRRVELIEQPRGVDALANVTSRAAQRSSATMNQDGRFGQLAFRAVRNLAAVVQAINRPHGYRHC